MLFLQAGTEQKAHLKQVTHLHPRDNCFTESRGHESMPVTQFPSISSLLKISQFNYKINTNTLWAAIHELNAITY